MQGLPADAATFGEERQNWTQQDELLATAIEVTDTWGRQIVAALVAVHGGKVRLGDPVRVEHPDRPQPSRPKSRITSDPQEIAEFFRTRIH